MKIFSKLNGNESPEDMDCDEEETQKIPVINNNEARITEQGCLEKGGHWMSGSYYLYITGEDSPEIHSVCTRCGGNVIYPMDSEHARAYREILQKFGCAGTVQRLDGREWDAIAWLESAQGQYCIAKMEIEGSLGRIKARHAKRATELESQL